MSRNMAIKGVGVLGAVFAVVLGAIQASAQGIPPVEPPPYVPKMLVGALPGDVSVDNTGAATFSMPLSVPPGTSGMQPSLNLLYNSKGNNNGALGLGFYLGGMSVISRTTPELVYEGFSGGISFSSTDRLSLDGQRLMLITPNVAYGADGSEYRTEIETFGKVVLHGEMNSSNAWFEVHTKAGLVYEYGNTADSFVSPSNRVQAASWAVHRVSDTAGNYMQFNYTNDVVNGEHLIESIEYTGNDGAGLTPYNRVEFSYEGREDARFRYLRGAVFNTTKRLSSVSFYVDSELVHEYEMNYQYTVAGISQLSSVQQLFANGDYLPPTIFEWADESAGTGFVRDDTFAPPIELTATDGTDRGIKFLDLNADGLVDIIYRRSATDKGAYLNNGNGWTSTPGFNAPVNITGTDGSSRGIRFVDINGDTLPDLLYNEWPSDSSKKAAYLNTGSGWTSAPSGYIPPLAFAVNGVDNVGGTHFVDLDLDGLLDLIYLRQWDGALERRVYMNTGEGWERDMYEEFPTLLAASDADPGAFFADIDASGTVDYIFSRKWGEAEASGAFLRHHGSSTWTWSNAYAPPYYLVDKDAGSTQVRLVDLNNDGQPDFVYHRILEDDSIDSGAHFGTGNGWATESTPIFESPIPLKVDGEEEKYVDFTDVNGDGFVDILCHNDDLNGAWLNSSTGWVSDSRFTLPRKVVDSTGKLLGTQTLDVDGDGLPDQLLGCGSEFGAWINQSSPPLLKKVISAQREAGVYAGATEIHYCPLTDSEVYTKGSGAEFPVYDIQSSMEVVSALTKENVQGDEYWSVYTYAGARLHRDRGFLGFQVFESYDPQTKISKIDYLAQDFPMVGVELKSETRYIPDPDNDPAGQLLKEVENTWLYNYVWAGTEQSSFSAFFYCPKSVERKWEFGNTNDVVSEVTTYNWFEGQDATTAIPNLVQYTNSFPIEIAHGNITKVVVDYGDGTKVVSENEYNDGLKRTESGLSYGSYSTGWYLGRLNDAVVTHQRTGKTDVVRESSFAYYSTTGLLGLETQEPNSKWLETFYEYDSFGNITNKTVSGVDIVSRSVQSSVYDSKGQFVTESENALGHSETTVADSATGMMKSRTGPNGLPSSWTYDPLGRPQLESRADGTSTTTTYAWETGVTVSTPLEPAGSNVTVAAAWSVSSQSSGTAPTTVYYDRQGHEIRTATEAPDGRLVYQDVGRNSLGQTVCASDPYFAGDTPNFGFTEYDELGRLKLIITPDGTKTAYGYQGLVSSVTNNFGATDGAANSRNQVTTTYKNAKGEVLKVVDNLGYKIQYQYDAAGNIEKTIDEASNQVVMEYDIRGNKIRQDDPDMGEWFYGYNALGELVAQTNANNQATSMEYDLLGRMTKRISPEGTAQWFYDGDSEGCWIGALHREEMSDVSGTNIVYRRTNAYDALGRPLLSLYSVDNKWYYTCNEYDEYSRVKSTHRFWRPKDLQGPEHNLDHRWNSFTSINTYNERGIVTKVEDGSGHVWWEMDASDFDAMGHRLEYTLGNDIVTSQAFDADSGRLDSIQLSNMSSGMHTYGFQFDRLGNLTQRSLARTLQTTRSEDFAYDKLNRLESATVGATVSSASYDAIGNIQTKTGVSGTYQYGGGSAGPHGVSLADGVTYTYDNCGNLLGRYVGGTNISSTAWTSFNKPSTMYNGFDGSEFTYDANQNRMIQIGFEDGNGTKKLYLDGFEQEEELTGNQFDRQNWQWSLKETRIFVNTPSGVVGVHVQDAYENVERRYFHYDHLGSVVAVSGEGSGGNASLIAEYSYDSWGKRRDASTWQTATVDTSSLKTDRGFTGHEMLDNLGLIHMNGRIYDPHLGRFLSADPVVQAPGDLQSYNRYSYVRNNPLTYTDPSGYSWLSKQWNRLRNAVSDAWNDIVEFHEKYWKVIVVTVIAVAVTVLTAGLAAPLVGGVVSGVWASVITGAIAGAVGGFAAGFSGTLLYGGSLSDAFENGLTGALWGGVSGAIAGGVGYYAKLYDWTAKAKALAHGLRGGIVSFAKGDSVEAGFLAGFGGGFFDGGGAIALIGASLVGGTASVIAGGKFASGAITAAFAVVAAGIGARFAARFEPQGARGPYPTSYPNDDSLIDYLKAGWRKISTWWAGDAPPEQAWNPTGRATVWKGGKFGGYVLAGGEAGRVTLKFDNGYLQDYGYVGGGLGFGGFACGADMCGVVYGVYEPSDYAGYFINIDLSAGGGGSFSYWQSVGGVSGGMASPGISGAFQGYWTIGKPYKAP